MYSAVGLLQEICVGFSDACDRRIGNSSAIRASRATYRREVDLLVLLLPPPCPPASTAPGEGPHGGLLEGSCGCRRGRGMPNRQTSASPPTYVFQNMKRSCLKAVRQKLLLAVISPFPSITRITSSEKPPFSRPFVGDVSLSYCTCGPAVPSPVRFIWRTSTTYRHHFL